MPDPTDPNKPAGDPKNDGGAGGEPKPVTHKIMVNGSERLLTTEELVTFAQKGASADERFQDAAKLKQEAQRDRDDAARAMKIVSALENFEKTGNPQDFRTAASELGVDQAQIEATLKELQAAGGNNQPPQNQPPPKPQPVGFAGLDDELKSTFKEVVGKIWDEDIKKGLASDKVLMYTVRKGGDQEAKLIDLTKKIIRRRVLEDPQSASNRARSISEAIQEARSLVTDIGTLTQPEPPPGFGPAPPTGSPELYPKTEPKRIESTQAGFSDFIGNKILWALTKAGKMDTQ